MLNPLSFLLFQAQDRIRALCASAACHIDKGSHGYLPRGTGWVETGSRRDDPKTYRLDQKAFVGTNALSNRRPDNGHIKDCPRKTRTIVPLNISHRKDLEPPSTLTYLHCSADRLQGSG